MLLSSRMRVLDALPVRQPARARAQRRSLGVGSQARVAVAIAVEQLHVMQEGIEDGEALTAGRNKIA